MKTSLVSGMLTVGLLAACGGDTTLQAIDGPEGTGGGGGASSNTTSTAAGGAGTGGSAADPVGPTLMVVHENGMTGYLEVADYGPLLNHTAYALPDGVPRAVTQRGPHIVVALTSAVSEVAFRQFDHFVNLDGSGGFVDATLQLEPIGSSSQLAGPLGADEDDGLWMLTTGVALGNGVPSNGLHWSPTGSVGGPWSVYESTPAISSWAVLPGVRSVIASTTDGLIQIELRRWDKSMALLADLPGDATYPALQVHERSLYGITSDCSGCAGAGELHIWRDLEPGEPAEQTPILGAPDITIPLPNDMAEACSLTVGARAVVVGACRTDAQAPHDPKLYAYEDPGTLSASSVPDASLVLPEDPFELASHHRSASTGAGYSVYVRTATPLGLIYDDRSGNLSLLDDRFGADINSPAVPSDIALVD